MKDKILTTTAFNHDSSTISKHTLALNIIPDTYIKAATSNNTRQAYKQDIRHFIAWGGLLPATSENVVHYLHENASELNPRTLERRIVAISNWHRYQNFPDPTKHPVIAKTLKGIKNIHGKPKNKAPALLLENLITIHNALKKSNTIQNLRNNALLQIQYFGNFRVSELIAIKYENLTFTKEGLQILIPRSKTDQENEGYLIAIPFGNMKICPITTLDKWLEASKINSGYIFRNITKNNSLGNNQLSRQSINLIINKISEDFSLNSNNLKRFSSHSLRRGFATEASRNGATLSSIMRQGRWKSANTVMEYVQEGQLFEDNAANSLLKSKNKE